MMITSFLFAVRKSGKGAYLGILSGRTFLGCFFIAKCIVSDMVEQFIYKTLYT